MSNVEIPFPDGSRVKFEVQSSKFRVEDSIPITTASVIKDAGDDPDITHGAEIVATVRRSPSEAEKEGSPDIVIKGGAGVGVITKPGLALPVGQPAINPTPRRMIEQAVREAIAECGTEATALEVTISVHNGAELARKTLNHRLGIVGGISILGTTGIVKPLSEAAWTATVTASFDVAKALGLTEVVLSTGRTSEKAHQRKFAMPIEAYAMMGDYVEFSLRDARKHGFRIIHLCAQWAKMIKIAMATPQTHVRHGALEAHDARDFLIRLGISLPTDRTYNTTREIHDYLIDTLTLRERDVVRAGLCEGRQNPSPPNLPLKGRRDSVSAFAVVCGAAKAYCERVSGGIPVIVHLVSYEGSIIAESR